MGRTARNRSTPNVKPVEKIELSEKNVGLRLVLIAILLMIGAGALAYGVNALFTVESGWHEIQADSGAELNNANEFVFMYELGVGEKSATVEKKALTSLYTDAVVNAYRLFASGEEFENVNNLSYINRHPNEVITVDPALYHAFEIIQNAHNRAIYMAPVYRQYDDIFTCSDDSQLIDFDPYRSEEVAFYYKEIAAYANDVEAINLELLGDSQIRLYVSSDYLKYAEENYITDFIDFFWMKNAFIVDYLADTLIEKGYTSGTISSFDGFTRNLDTRQTSYSLSVYDYVDGRAYQAASMEYNGARSIVYLRNYMMNSPDTQYYYQMENGQTRTPYLDVRDGLCKSAIDSLYAYSTEISCGEILMQVMPIYIADTLDTTKIKGLSEQNVYFVYCEDQTIYYNESGLKLTYLFDHGSLKYKKVYTG